MGSLQFEGTAHLSWWWGDADLNVLVHVDLATESLSDLQRRGHRGTVDRTQNTEIPVAAGRHSTLTHMLGNIHTNLLAPNLDQVLDKMRESQ